MCDIYSINRDKIYGLINWWKRGIFDNTNNYFVIEFNPRLWHSRYRITSFWYDKEQIDFKQNSKFDGYKELATCISCTAYSQYVPYKCIHILIWLVILLLCHQVSTVICSAPYTHILIGFFSGICDQISTRNTGLVHILLWSAVYR